KRRSSPFHRIAQERLRLHHVRRGVVTICQILEASLPSQSILRLLITIFSRLHLLGCLMLSFLGRPRHRLIPARGSPWATADIFLRWNPLFEEAPTMTGTGLREAVQRKILRAFAVPLL